MSNQHDNPGQRHQREIAIRRVTNLISNWDSNNATEGRMSVNDYNEALYQNELDNDSLNPQLVEGEVDHRGELIDSERRVRRLITSNNNNNVETSPSPQKPETSLKIPIPQSSSHSIAAQKWIQKDDGFADYPLSKEEIDPSLAAARNTRRPTNTNTSKTPIPTSSTTTGVPRIAKSILDQGKKLEQKQIEEVLFNKSTRKAVTPPILDPSKYALKMRTKEIQRSVQKRRAMEDQKSQQQQRPQGLVPSAFDPSPKIFKSSQERDEHEKRLIALEQKQLLEEKREKVRQEQEEEERNRISPPYEDDGSPTLHRYIVKDRKTGKIIDEGVEEVFPGDEENNENRRRNARDPPGSVRLYLDENETNPRMQVSVYSPNKNNNKSRLRDRMYHGDYYDDISEEEAYRRGREKLETRERERRQLALEKISKNNNRTSSSNHVVVGATKSSSGRLVVKKELEEIDPEEEEAKKKKKTMPDWLAKQYEKMNSKGTTNKRNSSKNTKRTSSATPSSTVNSSRTASSSNNNDNYYHEHQQQYLLSPHEEETYRDRLDYEESYAEVSDVDRRAQDAYKNRQATKAEYESNMDSASFKMMTADQHIAEGNRLMREAEQEARRLAKIEEQRNPHLYKINNENPPMSPNSAKMREKRLQAHFDAKEIKEEQEQEKLRKIAELKQRSSKIDPASVSQAAGRPTTPKSILQQQQRFKDPHKLFSSDKSVQFSFVSSSKTDERRNEKNHVEEQLQEEEQRNNQQKSADATFILPTSPQDVASIQRRAARRNKMDRTSTEQNVMANSFATASGNFSSPTPIPSSSSSIAQPHSRSSAGQNRNTNNTNTIPERFWSNDISSVEARNDPELGYGRISWRKNNNTNTSSTEQQLHSQNNNHDNNNIHETDDGNQVIMTQNVLEDEDNRESGKVIHFMSTNNKISNSSSFATTMTKLGQWQGNQEVRSFMGDLMLDESEYDLERRRSTNYKNKNNKQTETSSSELYRSIAPSRNFDDSEMKSSNNNELSHATLQERHDEHWEAIPGAQHREQEDVAKMSAATRSAHIQWRDSLRGNTRSQVRGPLADSATKPLLEVDTKMYSTVRPLPIDEHGRVVGAPNVVQKEINNVGKSTGGSGVVISSDSLNHSKNITDRVATMTGGGGSSYHQNQQGVSGGAESLMITVDSSSNPNSRSASQQQDSLSRPEWNNNNNENTVNTTTNATATANLSTSIYNNNPATEEFLQRKKQLWRERASKKRAEELRLQNELREEQEKKLGPMAAHRKLYHDAKNTASTSLSGTESFAGPLLSGRVKGLRRRPVSAGDKYRVAVAALEKVCDENERRRNLLGNGGGDDDYRLDGKTRATPKISVTGAENNNKNTTTVSRDAKSGVAVATVNSPTANMEQMAEEAKRARREAAASKNVSFRDDGRNSSSSPYRKTRLRAEDSFGAESSSGFLLSGETSVDDFSVMNESISKSSFFGGGGLMSRSASQMTSGTTNFETGTSRNEDDSRRVTSPKLMKKRNEKLVERQQLAHERATRFAREQPVPGADVKKFSDLRHHHSVMSPEKVAQYLPENLSAVGRKSSSPSSRQLNRNNQGESPNNSPSPTSFLSPRNRDGSFVRDDDYFVAGRATRKPVTYYDIEDDVLQHARGVNFRQTTHQSNSNSPTNLSSRSSLMNNNNNLQQHGSVTVTSADGFLSVGGNRGGAGGATSSSSVVNFLESSSAVNQSQQRQNINASSSNRSSGRNSPLLQGSSRNSVIIDDYSASSFSPTRRNNNNTSKNTNNNIHETTILERSRQPNDVVAAKAVTRAVRAATIDDKRIAEGKHPHNSKPAWMLSATQEDEKLKREKEKLEGNYFSSSSSTSGGGVADRHGTTPTASSSSSLGPWNAFRNPSKTPPIRKVFGVQHTSNRRKY